MAEQSTTTTIEIIERNLTDQSGMMSMVYSGGEWMVAIAFGEEEPGSEMAAGAAYGVGTTLDEALATALAETGWT